MNRQEIFNTVYLGLKSQGFKRSAAEGGVCYYRGPDGLKCAAGWLIPDEKYDRKKMEGYAIDHLWVNVNVIREIIDEQDVGFVENLQVLHDNCATAEEMEEELISFAETHNLTIPQGE